VTGPINALALRPRSGAEIIDAAVVALRPAYPACVAVWLVYMMTYTPLQAYYFRTWPVWAQIVVAMLASALPKVVLQVLLSNAYLGRPVRLDLALAAVARRAGAVYIVDLGSLLLVALGLVLLIVPGIWLEAVTFAAMPALVLENCGVKAAFARSRQLTEGHTWRIALTLGATSLISTALSNTVTYLQQQAAQHHLLTSASRDAIDIVLMSLIAPFVQAVVVLLYYDLRIRKEGLDLELQMIGTAPAPTPRPGT
jgi:hypothetical protein